MDKALQEALRKMESGESLSPQWFSHLNTSILGLWNKHRDMKDTSGIILLSSR